MAQLRLAPQFTVLKSRFPMLNGNNALGGLLSGAISGSSKIPLVQKLRGKGGETKTGSSNYLGHPVPFFGGNFNEHQKIDSIHAGLKRRAWD